MNVTKIIIKGISVIAKSAPAEPKVITCGKKVFGGISTAGKTTEKLTAETEKIIPKTVSNAVEKSESTAIKTAFSTAQIADEYPKLADMLKKNSNYFKFSDETRKCIDNFCNKIMEAAQKINNSQYYKNIMSDVKNLVNLCNDKRIIKILMTNHKAYNMYINNLKRIRCDLNFVQYKNVQEAVQIRYNLALMSTFNSKNFKTLTKSKGFNEIANGRLSIEYLKNLKPTSKIDEDFFYKLFDKIEKTNNARLEKAGIDVKTANKYLKMFDREICLNPQFANDFITKLEKADNPELINSILKKFDTENITIYKENFFKLLDYAAIEPQYLETALRIQKANLWSIPNIINLMKNKNQYKVSDELFEKFLKFEKTNPDNVYPAMLMCVNDFLHVKGADEKLVQKIFDNAGILKKNLGTDSFDTMFSRTNEHNIGILKSCIEKRELSPEDWFKFKILSTENGQKLSDDEILKLYNTIYKPLAGVLGKDNLYIADRVTELSVTKPEIYAKYKDSKILDLVLKRKISPRILQNPNGKILPEITADIQKLLKGESIIKKFDSVKDVLKKTQAGDVISVKGKMYINNKGKLERWNMTEEKFNELFPLVDRFSTQQGDDDCYLISCLIGMYRNPQTRGAYYKMFEQKGNDICVTIPAYKGYKGEVRFSEGEISTIWSNADAAKNVQMLERAYSRTALRSDLSDKSISSGKNPLTTDDLGYLQERIKSGKLETVMRELLPYDAVIKDFPTKNISDKKEIRTALENIGQNPRYIITEGFAISPKHGHARLIINYDQNGATVIDPGISGKQILIPIKEFFEKLLEINVTRVG